MWYAAVLRCLRRRFVLALIFCLSLTYCLINLLGTGGPLSKDVDEIVYVREKPLIWREAVGSRNSTTKLDATKCRNSVQGKLLIVDDEGYVCSRDEVLKTGCCNISTLNLRQYDCNTCVENGCCAIYEYCVSCCLNPNKKSILEQVMENASGRKSALLASVNDQFELCLAKCRTDSHSVEHENKYKNPDLKYCFGLTEAHESQREPRPNNKVEK